MVKRREQDIDKNKTQTEIPEINIKENFIQVSGYQCFKISKNKIFDGTRKLHGNKHKIVTKFIKQQQNNCNTLIDFGCSQGYYSYFSYFKGYNVKAFEHDPTYVQYFNKIKSHFNFDSKIEIYNKKFGEVSSDLNADICLFLALIHHVYKATDSFGSIKSIVDKLYKIVNKILIIEWIDKLEGYQLSTNYNNNIITESYTKKNLENALKIFSKIDIYDSDVKDRKIYVCYK